MGIASTEIVANGSVTDISLDYSRIVVACSRKQVCVYRKDGGGLYELEGHTKAVRGVVVNGDMVASCGMDETVRLWQCEPYPVM